MKRFALLVLLLALMVGAAGCGGDSTSKQTDSALVEQTVRSFASALVAGDAAKCASLSNQPEAAYHRIFALGDFVTYDISNLIISVNGAQATATFTAHIIVVSGGVTEDSTEALTWTLNKVGEGQWILYLGETIHAARSAVRGTKTDR